MKIEEYLVNICKHLGLTDKQFKVELNETEKSIDAKIVLPEEESGLFIGYHGETLQAIQRMVRISFYEELGEKRFRLNINDYREQREDQLKERLVNIALGVLETGNKYTFSYLSAHDRFLTHTILAEDTRFSDLESKSEGEGRDRYLSIQLKTKSE